MKVYIGVVDGQIRDKAYTSLLGVCEAIGAGYDAAIRGKRTWIYRHNLLTTILEIRELEVVKIKNRGKK